MMDSNPEEPKPTNPDSPTSQTTPVVKEDEAGEPVGEPVVTVKTWIVAAVWNVHGMQCLAPRDQSPVLITPVARFCPVVMVCPSGPSPSCPPWGTLLPRIWEIRVDISGLFRYDSRSAASMLKPSRTPLTLL